VWVPRAGGSIAASARTFRSTRVGARNRIATFKTDDTKLLDAIRPASFLGGRGAVTDCWRQAGCVVAAVLFWAGAAWPHDWYEDVQLEREGKEPLDCCGERDCAPYPHRGSAGELAYEVQIKGKWYAIDPASVVGEYSPDGQVHVCCLDGCETYAHPQIRCVILPGHGT
jgi:hypothetical protein